LPSNLSGKTESLLSQDFLKYSNLSKDSFSIEGNNNDFNSFEKNYKDNFIDNSGNEELNDYYDNFYK